MIRAFNKLKMLINSSGIRLNSFSGWIALIHRGFYFLKRYGMNSRSVLHNRYNDISRASIAIPQSHAQIWERIKPTHVELSKMYWAIPNLKKHLKFSIIIDAEDIDTLSSINKQIYDKYEILVGNLYDMLKRATGDYIFFLKNGDYLHKNALFEVLVELNRLDSTPDILYFDHDYFVHDSVDKPAYKPGWSPKLLLESNYIDRACAIKRSSISQLSIENEPFDIIINNIINSIARSGVGHHRPGILLTMADSNSYTTLTRDIANPYCDESGNENPQPVVCRMAGSPSINASGIHRIIVVKLDHIGDVILSIPSIRKIRRIFPHAQIDVLCATWSKSLLKNQPEIDNVYVYDFFFEKTGEPGAPKSRTAEIDDVITELRKQKYDLAINLRKHPDTKFITPKLADYCLVFSEDAESDEASHPVPAIKRSNHSVKWHSRDQLLSLVNALEHDESLNAEISVPSETQLKVNDFVNSERFFKNQLVIGMHIGGGGSFKLWSMEKYSLLCDMLITNFGAKIVLFGSKFEAEINQKLIAAANNKDSIISVAGTFSLLEYCCLVKNVDYFIGNDSGPAHIAGIQGVSTLVVWYGAVPKTEWSPIGRAVMQVECSVVCSPCYYACEQRDCISRIQPADVCAGLERLMLLFPSKRRER